MVRTQFDSNIKILHSDNGIEYIDKSFRAFLDDNGILFQQLVLVLHNKMELLNAKIVILLR